MLLFQLLLWALLLAPFAGLAFGISAAAAACVALLAALVACIFSLPQTQRPVAVIFLIAYAFVSALLFLSLFYSLSIFISLVLALAAWLALLGFLRLRHNLMDATVIGYDNGYAVVQVHPSLVAWVSPGVYAVSSKRVKKGQRVRVCFEWLSKKGSVV